MPLFKDIKQVITDPDKDPLGAMIIDYLNGDTDASVTVESPDLDMWQMTGKTMFRTFSQMNRIERKALNLCRGNILDIGAGAGCHSVYLQKKGFLVTALDHSCGCVEVLMKRGIELVIHNNLFCLDNTRYDTLLMLMNGIGIVGSVDGLNLFFQYVHNLLNPNGQLLLDSTDLRVLYDEKSLSQLDQEYFGQTEFVMHYGLIVSDPFDWLYIDFNTLAFYADLNGFDCKKIIQDKSGKFLACLQRNR